MSTARKAVKIVPEHHRHRPEQTLLYQIIEQHYPDFVAYMAQQSRYLPHYVQKEFSEYLKCGRLEHGFLRVQCTDCHTEKLVAFSCKRRGFCPSCGARRMAESAALLVDEVLPCEPMRQWVLSFPYQLRFLFASYPKIMSKVLGIVNRVITTHLIKQAGFNKRTACTGSVTLIQRFGSALNLNVHFHMLFLDGVYTETQYSKTRFNRVKAPCTEDLVKLVRVISQRVARFLERNGLIERDEENTYLQLDGMEEDPMQQLHGHSISYRIAIGSQQGRKVFTLQTLPAEVEDGFDRVAKVAGFSLHAGVATEAHQRNKLERLCRYITRPAVSEQGLALTSNGKIRYQLKTPYRDGTTHVMFEPLDFLAKLASLVPKPRVNLTRFHGVFAPNSNYRKQVTPARRGKSKKNAEYEQEKKTPCEHRACMTWAQRLKRVFSIDVETCSQCGGAMKVIACIEEQSAIDKILAHIDNKAKTATASHRLPETRAPPSSLFD